MADNNAGEVLRFEHGGVLKITPAGGTLQTVLNIESGTLSLSPTGYSTLAPDVDRGELNTHIRKGDKQPGTLAIDARFTGTVGADELYEILTADTGDQNKKKHVIVAEWYTDDAKTLGRSITLSNAVVAGQPTITGGDANDKINAAFITPSDFVNAAIAP